MNICPAYKNLYAQNSADAADTTAAVNADSDFRPDIFPLINDDKIACIKAIRANTPYRTSIRLFICHYYKNLIHNYCSVFYDEQADQKICESNKTNYVFFYVDKSENTAEKGSVYFLIFTKAAQLTSQVAAITIEIKKTAVWLGICEFTIQCYIFYYSTLTNTFHRDTLKNDFEKQCNDSRFLFQFQHILLNNEPKWLNINGGAPKFNIEVQKM